MENGILHSLLPLAEFKTTLCIDDREDALSRYCLVTATFAIEQYCRRRLFRKKHTDYLTFTGENIFTLREYPARKVLSVCADGNRLFEAASLLGPEYYYTLPGEGTDEDIPFSLVLRPPLGLPREERAIRVRYSAGYAPGKAPADLTAACLELAAWNMSRYRGRRIGITGSVRGRGTDGEHPEPSMPENVRGLLEPYKRRTL
jgi:hypothetical protein